MSRLLVIEDNANLANGLRHNLEYEGHDVSMASTAGEGLSRVRSESPDLIILDLMLPDRSGYRVLRELREAGDQTPVLVLTALAEEADKVRGFRAGADDYVTKPFGLLELLARVEALLRRRRHPDGGTPLSRAAIEFGQVVIHPRTRSVTRDGSPIPLRPKEFALLMALARRDGDVASRLDLLREVWGYHDAVMSRTVDTHMAELRRKLERDPAHPEYLLTVRKAGYRLAIARSTNS
jgi:DNA-binding response OmpR family regulator